MDALTLDLGFVGLEVFPQSFDAQLFFLELGNLIHDHELLGVFLVGGFDVLGVDVS